jgi:hypothetical protein
MEYGPLLMLILLAIGQPSGEMTKAPGPAVSMVQLFRGEVVPLSLTPAELTGAWATLRTNSAHAALAAGIGLNEGQGVPRPLYYTRGQTLNVEGTRYLVAYLPVKPEKSRSRAALTPDTRLALSLLPTDTLAALGELRPLNLKAALTEPPLTAKQARAINRQRLQQLFEIMQRRIIANGGVVPTFTADTLREAAGENLYDVSTNEPFLFNTGIVGLDQADLTRRVCIIAYTARLDAEGYRLALFADSRVNAFTAQQWQALCASSPYPPLSPEELAARRGARLHKLGATLLWYAREHDATLPPLRDPAAFPLLLKAYGWSPELTAGVGFNLKCSARALKAFPDRAAVVLAFDTDAAAGARAVLFTDGHTAVVNAETWKKLEATLGK